MLRRTVQDLIQTAHTGTFIQSSGRAADAGILKDVIVVEDSSMPANFASLAVFDKVLIYTIHGVDYYETFAPVARLVT